MTAIFYPDCSATSPSGRFILEARSPHNGTIAHRDGRAATDDEFAVQFGSHQSDFRYQLIDAQRDRAVVWERWQREDEDSPHEVIVADDGWAILRTHGSRPEVIAVAPSDGRDVLRVRVEGEADEAVEKVLLREPSAGDDDITVHWTCRDLHFTTAGNYWSLDAWPYFFRLHEKPFFAWRAVGGQRLVIDLLAGALVTESSPGCSELAQEMDEAEKRDVRALLRALAPQLPEIQRVMARAEAEESDEADEAERALLKRADVGAARAAIYLAGLHRLSECIPLLRTWESLESPSGMTGSIAMGQPWLVQSQWFRPIVQHALRVLGEQPAAAYPAYAFRQDDKPPPKTPPRASDFPERAAASLDASMSAMQVLNLLGMPDFVRKESELHGEIYRWTEDWEYDVLERANSWDARDARAWATLRITWEDVETATSTTSRIVNIEHVPAEWLRSDRRALEMLGF
jgi:hypothetical protein